MKYLRTLGGLLAICASISLSAQDSVTLSGVVEGVSHGRLHMIVPVSETEVDTIATADFGPTATFVLKGTLAEPSGVHVILENYSGGFFFFAEPGKHYEALLSNDDNSYIRGDGLQRDWLQHLESSRLSKMTRDSLQQEFEALRTQARFRSASAVNARIEELARESAESTQLFVTSHDDVLGAYIVYNSVCRQEADAESSKRFYAQLGDHARRSIYGRMLAQRVNRLQGATQGQYAPDFTLETPEGTSVTLSRVQAKVKIVDFWASWCGPCRMNNPKLKEIYAQYKDKGLEIIGVSLDNDAKRWQEAIAKDGLPWIQVSSLKGWKCSVASLYGVTTVPALFVVDEANRIIATHLRGEALQQFIARQLLE